MLGVQRVNSKHNRLDLDVMDKEGMNSLPPIRVEPCFQNVTLFNTTCERC